jgi:phosphoribosylformimino-5-aminoimidazole carboxamide ribotide isomerase
MITYPAIDIKNARCVRLLQGRADQETVYHDDPLQPAREFLSLGAQWLHVVDLDGAFSGTPANLDAIAGIAALGIKVQMGGGLRDLDTIHRVLAAGVSRAVVGTRACQDLGFVREMVAAFGDRVAVGIDARNGKVAVHGWTTETNTDVLVLAKELESAGVCTLIHTDITTDGMMMGPNLAAQEALLRSVGVRVIASGGVSRDADLESLALLAERFPHLDGVIVGKAIYEGKVSLERWLR